MTTRRAFIRTLSGALLTAPLAAEAQQTGKVPKIGVVSARSAADPDPLHQAFRQGLRELGYIEGKNIQIEYRYAHGSLDRFPDLVADLIHLEVNVILVGPTLAAQAAKAKTTTVPIVFALVSDPVGAGLVASLARPGGNATGLSNIVSELSGKQLELLKEAVPTISGVAVLHNPPSSGPALASTREAARRLAVELHVVEVRQPNELAGVFSAMAARRPDAVLALSHPVFTSMALSKLAATNRLPAMYARKEFAEAGGLLA